MKIIHKSKTDIEFGDVVQDVGGYYLVINLEGNYSLVELNNFQVLSSIAEDNPNNFEVRKIPSVLTIG